MKLPANAIGVTDIIQYRDCARRFELGMRRHTEAGEHPEAQGPSTAYGSAIHEAIAFVEEHDSSDEDAIQHAVNLYGRWLDVDDIARMREDLATYHERDPLGVRTVAVEREFRIPLFTYQGEVIYFRGKLDRLYQRLDNPGVFVHIDYKSSKWPKSEKEVHEDVQLWAYNYAIHEEFPECETLVQVYDQLRYGALPTRKTEGQREQIKEWLILQATAILEDRELEPTHNQWCAWCPLMESCPVVAELTDYSLAEIAALAPRRPKTKKDGTPSKVMEDVPLDPSRFAEYVAQLDKVGQAKGVLDRYETRVKDAIKAMSAMKRAELGYQVTERSSDVWPEEALQAVHEVLGDDFYKVAGLTKTRLTDRLGKDDERIETVLDMAERTTGAVIVSKTK